MNLSIKVKIKKLSPTINFMIPAAIGTYLMGPSNQDSNTSIQADSKAHQPSNITDGILNLQLLKINETMEKEDRDALTLNTTINQFRSKKFRKTFRKLNRKKRIEATRKLSKLCQQGLTDSSKEKKAIEKDLAAYCKKGQKS